MFEKQLLPYARAQIDEDGRKRPIYFLDALLGTRHSFGSTVTVKERTREWKSCETYRRPKDHYPAALSFVCTAK